LLKLNFKKKNYKFIKTKECQSLSKRYLNISISASINLLQIERSFTNTREEKSKSIRNRTQKAAENKR
jgi:hypothetical protein